jgi:iron complex outermembrane receptor protein
MALLAGASFVAIAAAAPPPEPAPQTAQPEKTLPELLILGEALADHRDQPVSASFLSDKDVEASRIQEPQDIVRLTPNMSASDSGSRSFGDVYSTRGLANTVFFGAPATTIYVDDVPFGETFTYAQRLSALNSVEVLRGPQPGIVGRNTYAGLINIRSRRPGASFEGEANYTASSFDGHDFDFWTMGPINDSLGFRIGGQWETRDGFLKNPLTGERVDDMDHWGLHGGLFWKPAPGWDVSFTASYDEFDAGAPRLAALNRPEFFEVQSDTRGEQHLVTDNQALRISYEADTWKFLSVTSRRNWDLAPYIADLDFSAIPLGSLELYQDQELWSQEFRFSSNDPDRLLDWTAGAYFSTGEINGTGFRYVNFPNQVMTDTRHRIEEDMFALFGSVAYKGWKPVTVRAGVRADWVDRSIRRTHLLVAGGFPFPQTAFNDSDDWFHVTPSAGLDWRINENVLAYVKTSYAFKPGGFSAYADDASYIPFDEEKSWSSEIGIKTKWLDGKATIDLAAFYNDIDGYQVERSFTQVNYAVFNADHAKTYGAELEARLAVTDYLDLQAAAGWTHARLTRYTDPLGNNLDDNIPPFVPEFDAALAADFHLENGFFARLEYLVVGDTSFDDFNRTQFQQDTFGLLNASVGFRTDTWSTTVFATNLTGEEYYTNMNTDIQTGAPGAPREFGVKVGLKF